MKMTIFFMNLEIKNPFLLQPSNQFVTIQTSITWWHPPVVVSTEKLGESQTVIKVIEKCENDTQ